MASTTVNFNLKTAGYVNYANQTLTFKLLTAGAEAASGDQSYVTLPGIVTATSAANGDGSATLYRNGKSGIDSVYEVILPNREKAKFIIPSGSATIELATLLVDHVPGGSDTQQSSVYTEAIKRANHTGTQPLSTISDASTVQLKPSEGAFANGDKTKLDAIEASADVTDTANVTSAGALMDSELTDLAGVKGVTISTLQVKPSEGAFANGDKTKLNAIEASADVTDTTNVTAAGALMDSELADLTGVKTLLLPDSTTISDFAKTFLDDTSADAVRTTLGSASVNYVPGSITFTNTSAFLSLADNAALDVDAGDFSLSFWARLDSSGTEPVLTKLSGTGYRLRFVSGALILTMQDSGGSADFSLATGLNDNKWHTYVVTVDRSGNAIAYVDNVAQTGVDVSGTAGTLANGGQFQIGSDGGSNAGDGIALGNYVSLHKTLLSSTVASYIYFSPDTALGAGSTQLMVDLRKATNTFNDIGTNGLAVTTNGTIIFNESRIVQQSTTGTTTGFTAGSGTAAKSDSTFTGGSGTAYTIGDIVKALKAQGLLAQ